MRTRAFTGLQPTGALHLGNYLGAIRPWVERQRELDGFFAVVDLHALTVLPDPRALREATRTTAALCLAAGVDPEHTTLFVQSHVPEHAELAWVLGCLCPFGWLLRMVQFKEKAAKEGAEKAGAGLLTYPVLMAADILLYDAEVVPVGEDQRQHLELCRALARRLNAKHGEVLRVPAASVPLAGARVMGLDDPTQKMSKSAPGPYHRIGLLDPPEQIRRAIARATTDSGREVVFDPEGRPGISNLVAIEAALSRETPERTAARYAGRGYGDLKRDLAEHVIEMLRPIRERHRALAADPAELDRILRRGAERAHAVASATMHRVRTAVGLT